LKKREKYGNFILGDSVDKIKTILKNKFVIIGVIVVAFISLVVAIILIIGEKEDKFALNSIYNVFPEDVRKLYSNTIEISCAGDLYLDIDVEDGEVSVDKLDKKSVITYVLSHIDKNYGLHNEITEVQVKKNIDKLIDGQNDLIKYIEDYQYGDYNYSIENGKLVREKNRCKSDVEYVSYLYGYSYGTKVLSMDVNIGYLKDGVLYDVQDKKLGKYDGKDLEELKELFRGVPYYRYNYIKDEGNFKLKSVSLNLRTKRQDLKK